MTDATNTPTDQVITVSATLHIELPAWFNPDKLAIMYHPGFHQPDWQKVIVDASDLPRLIAALIEMADHLGVGREVDDALGIDRHPDLEALREQEEYEK